MSRTAYDEALLVTIADRANAGEDVRALAEEHNLAYKPLYLALLRRGRFVRRHHRWWTKKEIAAAWHRVSILGESVPEVAERFEVSEDAIRHIFSKNGLHLRAVRNSPSRVVENQRIYAMRKDGATYADIGEALGYGRDDRAVGRIHMRLLRYCERAGIQAPSTRPAVPRIEEVQAACPRATPEQIQRAISVYVTKTETLTGLAKKMGTNRKSLYNEMYKRGLVDYFTRSERRAPSAES